MISLYLPGDSKIGSGYQAHYLANALVERGHRVTLFSPDRPGEGARYYHRFVDVGNWLTTFRFAWRLRHAGLEKFDLIHAHGDDYWLWGDRFPPHVRTMHGSNFAEIPHVPGLKSKLRMALLGLSEILATRTADRTFCVSSDTCRYYPGVEKVIPNGIDLKSFYPCEPDKKEQQPTILFVGTYQNRKRGRLLLEQFQEVVQPQVPDARLWMVCGDAPEADGVTVFGRVSTEMLTDLYRRATVFCLPSSYEGFGVPYVEAMASGTPVVATPNPGARDVLNGGRYGRLINAEELGDGIVSLLRDPEQQRYLREAGLERAKRYRWDRIVQEYEKVYAELLTGEAAGTGVGRADTRGASA
jgi:glycosyltransferase involved in cell wall biosynthesis